MEHFTLALVKVDDRLLLMVESSPLVISVKLTTEQAREFGEALIEGANKAEAMNKAADGERLLS